MVRLRANDPLAPALEMMAKALGIADWRELLVDGAVTKEADTYTLNNQPPGETWVPMVIPPRGAGNKQTSTIRPPMDSLPSFVRE